MTPDIGGYFELELHKGPHHYHDTPYAMKSGRSSLHCILTLVQPELVYVPYYTCDALLEPLKLMGCRYRFYAINEDWEPAEDIILNAGEYLVYVNYFGIKDNAAERLSKKYKDKLIIDATQAFFQKGNGISWLFNSCRKFFGVPDGSYLYTPAGMPVSLIEKRNDDYITDHLIKRFNGHTQDGYEDFITNEELINSDMVAMSRLSEYLLSGVDYLQVMNKRRENFKFLHAKLGYLNQYKIVLEGDTEPVCYPLLLAGKIDKNSLYHKRIFIPSFWKDVQERGMDGFDFEKSLTDNLLPLPVDHRYSTVEMEAMATAIINIIEQR